MMRLNRTANLGRAASGWRAALVPLAACSLLLGDSPLWASESSDATVQEWDFRVLLDDNEIGYHRFRLEEAGDRRYVESDAEFDVKFLFFTAYRYRHSNRESWEGDCLASIATKTNTNGDTLTVTGEQSDETFVVETPSGIDELPQCVMTFAYWDRKILDQSKLLNVQTGELVDVAVEVQDAELLEVRGEERMAQRYRLVSDGIQIDVWYAPDGEWLALESPAKGGRVLRYELT